MTGSPLQLLLATLAGAVLGAFADWLFAGLLFRHRYHRYREIWREGNQRQRIILSQALALVSAAGFVLLAAKLHQTDPRGALKLAAMIWLIAPLPLLVANGLWVKVDPLVTLSHAAGWLAKLLLIALAAAWLLP